LAEGIATLRNVGRLWFKRWIREQGLHDGPVALILAGKGQARAPVVGLIAEVQFVEPVSGIVAVVIHVLPAKQVVAGKEKWNALAECDQTHRQNLPPRAGWHVVGGRGFELHSVEKRLVVMHRAVVDVLDGT